MRQLIQAFFWGAWVGLFLMASSQTYPLTSGAVLISTTVGVGCWVATELLRMVAFRWRWLELPAWKLLPQVGISLAMSAWGVQLLVFLVLMPVWWLGWVTLAGNKPDYRPGMILLYWFNTLFMLGVWTAIWLFVASRKRARRLERQRLEDEVKRRVLELDSLRSRLNPHFVFNALNNVRALINEDTERARELVTRLSNTLRYALYYSQQGKVTLEQEVAVVDDYLAIEQVHYESRLCAVRDVAPEALSAELPPMLLQLLVENAIKHGIAQNPNPSEVHLRAWLADANLCIAVSNPGQLRKSHNGVGLSYLQARLKTWSDAARFSLDEHDGLITARLSLPQEQEERG